MSSDWIAVAAKLVAECALVVDSERFLLWAARYHSGTWYAVFEGGVHWPLVAHRPERPGVPGSVWYVNRERDLGVLLGRKLACLCESGVEEISAGELSSIIFNGEPPLPAAVQSLLSVCSE